MDSPGNMRFLIEAQEDYDEAFGWYLSRSEQAASRFEMEPEKVLRRIEESPESWPKLTRKHRFCLLRRFPYYVVYRLDQKEIVVVAVAHGRRRQNYWRKRK